MVFSSRLFLFVFLPAVLLLYFLVPRKLRNALLLVASVFFYAWGENIYVGLFLFVIAINFVAGLAIGDSDAGADYSRRRLLFVLIIAANLALLAFFKYFNFAVDSWNALTARLGAQALAVRDPIKVTLPLGISFFIFHALSYQIDLYRGHVRSARNFINFATYVSLFPQLVAGPIVRYVQVAGQLVDRKLSIVLFSEGVRRFVLGLGKKVIIANTLAVPADQIFALPDERVSTGLAWFGVLCYTLQIYFDFSGYSDMAIGLGKMFGFRFLENFNYPYISKSVQEFWRRWHISLSTWFRDYVYIPLGGNRGSTARTYFNLVIVFFLCGLWHGASWTFVVWGLYHGFFLVLERLGVLALVDRLWAPVRHLYALLVVFIGWLIFRAESFSQVGVFLRAMFTLKLAVPGEPPFNHFSNNHVLLAIALGIIGSIPWIPAVGKWMEARIQRARGAFAMATAASSEFAVTVFVLGVFLLSCMLLSVQTENPFIYFRF